MSETKAISAAPANEPTEKVMTTVYHPTLTDVKEEIDMTDLDSWTKSGWLTQAPE